MEKYLSDRKRKDIFHTEKHGFRKIRRLLFENCSTHSFFDQQQRAFLPTDGCLNNVTLLDLIMTSARGSFKSYFITVPYVSKAFDR